MTKMKIVKICVLNCLKERASLTVVKIVVTLDLFLQNRCQMNCRKPRKEKETKSVKVRNVLQNMQKRNKRKETKSVKVRSVRKKRNGGGKRKETESLFL